MLASAYAAARVHALPSWYELPGLVSLEAAYNGCNVVVTDNGTARDYLGNDAFYCNPGDEQSICQAVMEAYASDVPSTLRERVMSHTWDGVGAATLRVYEAVLGRTVQEQSVMEGVQTPALPARPALTLNTGLHKELIEAQEQVVAPGSVATERTTATSAEFSRYLEQGEAAAQEKEYAKAHELLGKALYLEPNSVRALKAQGAVYLAEKHLEEARRFFEKAHQIDQSDARTLSGLGMCCMVENDPTRAYPFFVEALKYDPTQMIAILQLIEASYMIEQYDDLERVLREYLKHDSEDDNMQFCLAGCLYRLERFDEAEEICRQVLLVNPNHLGSNELSKKIEEAKASVSKQEASSTPTVEQSAPVTTVSFNISEEPKQEQSGWARLAQQAIASVEASRSAKIEERAAAPQPSGVGAQKEDPLQPVVQHAVMQSPSVQPAVTFSTPTPPVRESVVATPPVEMEVLPDAQPGGSMAISTQLAQAEEAKHRRDLEECLECAESILKRSDASVDQRRTATLLKAEAYVLSGRSEEACGIFESILREDPGNPRALCGQGAVLASQSDWINAAAKFEQALTTDPRYDVAIAGLGLKAASDGDAERAWQLYGQALDINPENRRALLGVIELGYSRKAYLEVENALKRYLDMHPVDLNFLYSLAGCYYAQGKLEEALSEVRKITLFEPHHEQACELKKMIDDKLTAAPAL
jgi:tetratricopeptide (TPR) repeat protein